MCVYVCVLVCVCMYGCIHTCMSVYADAGVVPNDQPAKSQTVKNIPKQRHRSSDTFVYLKIERKRSSE